MPALSHCFRCSLFSYSELSLFYPPCPLPSDYEQISIPSAWISLKGVQNSCPLHLHFSNTFGLSLSHFCSLKTKLKAAHEGAGRTSPLLWGGSLWLELSEGLERYNFSIQGTRRATKKLSPSFPPYFESTAESPNKALGSKLIRALSSFPYQNFKLLYKV